MGTITLAFLLSAAITAVSYAIYGLLYIANDTLSVFPELLSLWKNRNIAELITRLKDWMSVFVTFSMLVTAIVMAVFLWVSYSSAFFWQT